MRCPEFVPMTAVVRLHSSVLVASGGEERLQIEGKDRIVSIHRYSAPSLLWDGFRAAFGIAATLGPLAFLDVAWPLNLALFGLGAVFVVFAFRVALQGLSPVELSDEGISRRGPAALSLSWRDMTSLRLAHYAAPRRPQDGWYQLTLAGNRSVLKVESTIDGFHDIVTAAFRAAEASGLVLDPVTGDNLKGLGQKTGRSPLSKLTK